MLLGTLSANLLVNVHASKGAIATGQGPKVIRVGEGAATLRHDLQCCFIFWLILKYKDIIKRAQI